MIANSVIKLVAGLHGVDDVLLMTVFADCLIDVFGGFVSGAERGQRVEHDAAASGAQFFDREQRRLPELCDVG